MNKTNCTVSFISKTVGKMPCTGFKPATIVLKYDALTKVPREGYAFFIKYIRANIYRLYLIKR